jgi:tRNA splicing ligase
MNNLDKQYTPFLQEILDNYEDESFLIADGFDDAIIGVEESSMRLIYSVKRCIEILMSEDMTYEDAIEHFNYNVSGGYVGEKTPIWCQDNFFV